MGNSCTRDSTAVVAFSGSQKPSSSTGRGCSLSSPALRKENGEKKRRTKAMHPGKRRSPCCRPKRKEHMAFSPRSLRYAAPPDFNVPTPTTSSTSAHTHTTHASKARNPHAIGHMERDEEKGKTKGKFLMCADDMCDYDDDDDDDSYVDEHPTACIERPLSFRDAEDGEDVSRGRSYSDTQMIPLTYIGKDEDEDEEIMDPSIPVKVPMSNPPKRSLGRNTRASRRKSTFVGFANAEARTIIEDDMSEHDGEHEFPGRCGLSIDAEFVSEEEYDTECTTDEEERDSSYDSSRSKSGSESGSESESETGSASGNGSETSDHESSDVSSEASEACARMPSKLELQIEYPGVQPFPDDVFSDRKNASGRKHSRYEMIDGQYVEKCQPSPISEYPSILKKSRKRAKSHGDKSMRKKFVVAKEIPINMGIGDGTCDVTVAEIPSYQGAPRKLIGTRASAFVRGVHAASDTQMERSKRASKKESQGEEKKRKNSSSAPELKRRKSRKTSSSKPKMINASRVAFDKKSEQVRFFPAEAPSDIFKHKFTRRKTADADYCRSYASVLARHALKYGDSECHFLQRRKPSTKKHFS
eukprot:TRINITY_DN559_c0_g1_i1.p1 TRINITY_DN559_c0_g1~~TRINITY_DN559_c0_g1_i1.p1  ORF type:complete len:585 (+),score=164.35 TRINITY_DN559_c0_g1_i1:300-2054(+)